MTVQTKLTCDAVLVLATTFCMFVDHFRKGHPEDEEIFWTVIDVLKIIMTAGMICHNYPSNGKWVVMIITCGATVEWILMEFFALFAANANFILKIRVLSVMFVVVKLLMDIPTIFFNARYT